MLKKCKFFRLKIVSFKKTSYLAHRNQDKRFLVSFLRAFTGLYLLF